MDSARIQAMFASGGGIDATEARQLVVAANRDKSKLAEMLRGAGIAEDHAVGAAETIIDVWSKANSGVKTDGQYLDKYKKESGGDGVLNWDPSQARFVEQLQGSTAVGPNTVPAAAPPMSPSDRQVAMETALSGGDFTKAQALYAGASAADRAAVMDKLLASPAFKADAAAILAADKDLVKVLEAAPSGNLRGKMLSALVDAVQSAGGGNSPHLSRSQATEARLRIGQFIAAKPSRVETVLNAEGLDPAKRKAMALMALEGFATHAPRTAANFAKLVQLIEMGTAASDGNAVDLRRDVTRALRRVFYTDQQMQFVGLDMGQHEPSGAVTAAVDSISHLLRGGKGWQEVPSFDGKKVDVAHALVAADAYANHSQLAAWVFTDFGDWASGRLADVGKVLKEAGVDGAETLAGAGNDNEADIRGNDMGERLYDKLSAGSTKPLSQLIQDEAP